VTTKQTDLPWRPYAWNGIRFQAPAHWDVAGIGPRYLLLASGSVPALEVKWNTVHGHFSPRTQLRRLAAVQGRGVRRQLKPKPLPRQWEALLKKYDSLGFAWQAAAAAGRGVLLFCRQCRTATLIQFVRNPRDEDSPVEQKILASFADHDERAARTWCVFDIRAEIPAAFHLKAYRFEAGEYELTFARRRETLSLYRWSPAAVILSTRSLATFARDRLGLCDMQFSIDAPHRAEGVVHPEGFRLGRLLRGLNRQAPHRRLRLWHENAKNRILAVMAASHRPMDGQLFNMVCSGYESV
jgi:hypothetical protein